MMSGNTEILYWRKDKSWYKYDQETDSYSMTDEAPQRAKESFELCKEFNRKYSRKKKARKG